MQQHQTQFPSLADCPLIKSDSYETLAKEFKVTTLREMPLPAQMSICDCADRAADYWREHISTGPRFNPDVESFAVLLLNTRFRIRGHVILSTGTLDTILIHPRCVFRAAIIANAAALVLMHNHPSGEADPSEADIKVTRDLIRGGQVLKVDIKDHVIMGHGQHRSLRELGFFYS